MNGSPGIKVSIEKDLEEISRAAAEGIIGIAKSAVRDGGRFCLNLSGGSTPKRLYALLGGEFKSRIPWAKTHLFWGDERYVPRDHPSSNYRMALETMISGLQIPENQIHSVPVESSSAEAAAVSYESHMRRFFADGERLPRTTFDVTLLGMGEDGHTASLFPGDSALDETSRWAVAVTAPADVFPQQRITMTLPALNRSSFVFFLVSGEKKREVALSILSGESRVPRYPAAMVRGRVEVVWYVDSTIIEK